MTDETIKIPVVIEDFEQIIYIPKEYSNEILIIIPGSAITPKEEIKDDGTTSRTDTKP